MQNIRLPSGCFRIESTRGGEGSPSPELMRQLTARLPERPLLSLVLGMDLTLLQLDPHVDHLGRTE